MASLKSRQYPETRKKDELIVKHDKEGEKRNGKRERREKEKVKKKEQWRKREGRKEGLIKRPTWRRELSTQKYSES